jgi:hypothetical protein
MLSWFSSITIIGNLIGAPVGSFIILAGLLIARLDYLYSFWILSLMLLLSLPIFIYHVKAS